MIVARCPHCEALHTPAGLIADEARGVVTWPGGEMKLPAGQLPAVFAHLLRRAGAVVTGEALLAQIYQLRPDGGPENEHTVSVWMSKLRKLMGVSAFPGEIRNHWGRGYELILHPIQPAVPSQKVGAVA